MIHVYYGDGKGKTSAALGLALRACGAGKSVAFYSFLKDNNSSERLTKCDIQFYQNPDKLPFLFSMTQQEKDAYAKWAKQAAESAFSCDKDVIVLDEFLDVLTLLGEEFVKNLRFSPDKEYVITGHSKCEAVWDKADYITFMRKERHPYDLDVPARRGIEF